MSKVSIIEEFKIFKNKSGIYKFLNKSNGKVYIGQSKDIYKRLASHIYRINYKKLFYLHNSIKKYGIENFVINIIELISLEKLDEREQYWIDYYKSYNRERGYNLAPKAASMRGFKMPEESKLVMAEKRRKYFFNNPESKIGLGERLKNGRTFEVEKKRLNSIRQFHKNNPHPSTGKILSEEHKNRIRQGMLAYKQKNHE